MARPWYSFYPADYARDTGHLSMLEHGAYRLLMDHYYSTGEPLSTDVERLLRLCRATVDAERAAIRFVLNEFFVLGDDGYHHLRIDLELIKAAEKAAKCSEAGLTSAAKRQQSTQQNCNGRTNGRSTDGPTKRQPSQSQSHTSSVPSDVALPVWMAPEVEDAWKGWLEMRKRIKAPLTDRALRLALKELEDLREKGHDPTAMIDTATLKNWKSFYAPKDQANDQSSRTPKRPAVDQHLAGMSALASARRSQRAGGS